MQLRFDQIFRNFSMNAPDKLEQPILMKTLAETGIEPMAISSLMPATRPPLSWSFRRYEASGRTSLNGGYPVVFPVLLPGFWNLGSLRRKDWAKLPTLSHSYRP